MADNQLLDAMAAAADAHRFVSLAECACGVRPETGEAWNRHLLEVAATAVARWLRGRSSPTLNGDRFILAVDLAADMIEGGSGG